jgi:hypothetical protein
MVIVVIMMMTMTAMMMNTTVWETAVQSLSDSIPCVHTLLAKVKRLEETNPGLQFARVTTFCTVVPNICGSSVLNLLYVTLLAPMILGWLPHFGKFVNLFWLEGYIKG